MRFEPLERDGLGRIGVLELDGKKHTTPTTAFVDTEKYPAPPGSLTLSIERGGEAGLVIARSRFATGPEAGEAQADLRPGTRGSPYAPPQPAGGFATVADIAGGLLDSTEFVAAIGKIKGSEDLLRPLYCSVMGLPHRLALLTYCGFDVFDSVPLIMAAENGTYLTTTGPLEHSALRELPCSCPACSEGVTDKKHLLAHNCHEAISELKLVRHAISQGRLRELVESRVRSDPWLVQDLRLLDLEHYELLEMHTPVRGSPFHAGSKESLMRPDIVRWRRRLEARYAKPEGTRILLLFPCSARKPYSLSQSHKRFREAVASSGAGGIVHEVVVTSPLGLVPRELELFYPAKDYDIPVTGHWDNDEKKMAQEMVTWLVTTQRYDLVISHLGDEREPVNAVLKDFEDTSLGHPGSRESLDNLEAVLREHAGDTGMGDRTLADMRALCVFQFGPAGGNLCEGAVIAGRWPNLKIMRGRTQLGMLTGERGMVSLTMDGARVLASADAYCVEIDDFAPKGNLFAIGVEKADGQIRIGDDVAVTHKGEVRAAGVAKMTPVEMELAERGEAVHIRHSL